MFGKFALFIFDRFTSQRQTLDSYGAPAQSYGPPTQETIQEYVTPVQEYGPPTQEYGPPASEAPQEEEVDSPQQEPEESPESESEVSIDEPYIIFKYKFGTLIFFYGNRKTANLKMKKKPMAKETLLFQIL